MPEEEWRQVEKFEKYFVSNLGRVKKIFPNRELVMQQYSHHKGYKFLYCWHKGERRKYFVHRLVAVAFIPNPQMKLIVNHLDEDKANNAVHNLEWCTEGENVRYSWARKGIEINPNNEEF